MHRLPSLAVGYIKIVAHSGLACNSVVASYTKPAALFRSTWLIGTGRCELRLYGVLRSSKKYGAWSRAGTPPLAPALDPARVCLLYGPWTSTLAQLAPASLLASTMQMSVPLPPLAVSRMSPSATLILSEPPPRLTKSVSLV
jgi:hypothetical protein